VRIKKFQQVFI